MAEKSWKYNKTTKRWEEVKTSPKTAPATTSTKGAGKAGKASTTPTTSQLGPQTPGTVNVFNSKTRQWEKKKSVPWTDDERERYGFSGDYVDSRTANAILRERRARDKYGAPTDEEIDTAETNAYNAGATTGAGSGKRGGDPYARLLATLRGLGDSAAGNINSSMDALTQTLQGQANPFADFKAQQTQTTPELSQLLQSQGVSQDPLQQFAAAINAQNQGQATAFQNQANTMRDIYGANQAGSISDVAQQRSDLMAQLQGNVFGTGAKLMGKQAPDRNAILQMILQSMKAGK
jgi:hypothetical protein